jgi:hypothetical protein
MNAEFKDAATVETKIDTVADLVLENFEIEDLSDLNLYAPVSISFCSSCCSSACS